MDKVKRGIAICHFNRLDKLGEILKAVAETAPPDARIVVCDDGSDSIVWEGQGDITVADIAQKHDAILLQGPNLGVAANKNRALWALQDCHYLCILEDDLVPTEEGWFQQYELAAQLSGIHHFCRVQRRMVPETVPAFAAFMQKNGLTPCYGPSPRGDLTFLTSTVVARVGAFNPRFRGAGYAHGEWSHRVHRAGLIPHPNKWVDIAEPNNKFKQVGDTEGGRWNFDEKKLKQQLNRNKQIYKELQKSNYTFHELVLE